MTDPEVGNEAEDKLTPEATTLLKNQGFCMGETATVVPAGTQETATVVTGGGKVNNDPYTPNPSTAIPVPSRPLEDDKEY